MQGGIQNLFISFLQGAAVCFADATSYFRDPARNDFGTTSKRLGTRGAGLVPLLMHSLAMQHTSLSPLHGVPG